MGICETSGKNKGKIKEPELLEKTNLSDMENCICKINGDSIGTGFFCKIEYNNKTIPVLITNYHIIGDEFLEKNKSLKVYIKNDYHLIDINKDSKIYSNDNKNK